MSVNVDQKQQLINNVCNMFMKLEPDVETHRVRDILNISLNGWQVQQTTTEVAIYQGDSNEQFLKMFLVSKKVNGCTKRTINYYGHTLSNFLSKISKPITEINANDIRIYLAERELIDKVTTTTRENERRNLSSFFTWLTDEEFITKNPMKKIPKIKGRKEKKKAFSDIEIEMIRGAATNEKYKAIIEILLSTGCRVSELVGIKLDEINGDKVIVHGKGQKDRFCYLNAKAQVAISNYMETDFFKTRKANGNPYLFAREKMDEPNKLKGMAISSVESICRTLGTIAGVNDVHPHRFRRTCATNSLKRGMPIEQVSKMLGHESLETTQIYLDLDEETLQNDHRKYVV